MASQEIETLTTALSRLPGLGPRSARRAVLWLIKRRGRTLGGAPIEIERKPMHRGTIVGGLLFGVGWSIAGMCPGPILVNIGEGKVYAFAALAGAVAGAGLYGTLYERLQGIFRLPPLKRPSPVPSPVGRT